MKTSHPPRLAVWLLKHFGPEINLEALLGDLQEAFSQGKSEAWYWRQVLAAIHWRKHISMLVIPVAVSWFMTLAWMGSGRVWMGISLSVGRLLYMARFTSMFLAVRYLPEIVAGRLGRWLYRALTMFFFLQYYPWSVLLLLIAVLHRKALSSRGPDAEQQRLVENLHMSLLQEPDPKLRMAYEKAITKLKSTQKSDPGQPI